MQRLLLAVATVSFVSATAGAQPVTSPAVRAATQDPQAMLAELEAEQAAARRPGDDALDCGAIEAEFTAIVNDPAIQAQVEAAAAAAQQDLAALESAQRQMAGKSVATAAATLVPGASMARMHADAAEAQMKQAPAAQRVQERMAQGQQLAVLMPKLMRGQRLIELGTAKGCEFAGHANLDAGIQPGADTPKP